MAPSQSNSSNFAQHVIINIKSQNFCNISRLVQNDKTVQNPKHIATIFNQYFVNIGCKIDAEITRTRKFPLDYLGRKVGSLFFLILTNSAEIASITSQYKS